MRYSNMPKRSTIIERMKRTNGNLSSEDASKLLNAIVSIMPEVPHEHAGDDGCIACGNLLYQQVLELEEKPAKKTQRK